MTLLATDSQPLPARGEHAEVRRCPDERRDRVGGRRQELFEVVEDQEGRLVAKPGPERLADGLLGGLADADRGGDRGFDESRVAERREVDEPGPVREATR